MAGLSKQFDAKLQAALALRFAATQPIVMPQQ
jgi:hypothetical protein